jgi:hypothetical protein
MKWAGHVTCSGDKRNIYRVLVGKSEGRKPFGRVGIEGMMILKWILQRMGDSGLDCCG